MAWLEFIVCAVIVIAASYVLSRYADVIAEKAGLGRAVFEGEILASRIYLGGHRVADEAAEIDEVFLIG